MIEARRLLNLIAQLDDAQTIILSSYLFANMQDNEFQNRHQDVLQAPFVHMQSPREEMDEQTVHDLGRSQLAALGLLLPRVKAFKKGELPGFDPRTGAAKRSGYELTQLGRLLLCRMGIASEDDM